MGFVGEDDAGAAVIVVAVGVRDDGFLDGTVRQGGVDGWGRVTVGVGDQDVFVAVRG